MSGTPSDGANDAVLATIVANRFRSIATIMADTMVRTSRSPIFQALDVASAIFHADGRLISVRDYNPLLAGSLPTAWRAMYKRFGGEVLEGDVYLLNDPFHGNNHPPDVTVFRPVFYKGALRFWTLSKGHNADVGGGGVCGYNPEAADIYDDALRIPPVRVYRAGKYERDVWELILLNIRLREIVEGDLHCQIGATKVGEVELITMLDKFGPEPVEAAINHHLQATREHMLSEIRKMRPGVYRAERTFDSGGKFHRDPITIRATATISAEGIVVDLSESDAQVVGFVNSTQANTSSAVTLGIFAAVDPELRVNAGSIGLIRIISKPGTIVDAVVPAATTMNSISPAECLIDCMWLIVAQARPESSNAGWYHSLCIGAEGLDPRTGQLFATFPTPGIGGSGATYGFDGWDNIAAAGDMGGTTITDAELNELYSPFTYEAIQMDTDSAGAGRWRGGAGGSVRWRSDAANITCVCFGSGALPETAAFGLEGGDGPSPSRVTVERANGTVEDVLPNTLITVNKGDILVTQDSGGGGYGNPLDRDVELVVDDVLNDIVSAEQAEVVYGVIIEDGRGYPTAARTSRRASA
jgi:N-methylhydantoinase B